MMRKIGQMKKDNQGFTLVELMIVVAIIGILAAIAIPQFAAYRMRAFNSAAMSDLRNVATGEEALFADTQAYGTITTGALATGVSVAAAGVIGAGPWEAASAVVGAPNGAFLQSALGTHGFAVSNGVVLGGSHTVTAAPVVADTYVLVSKHTQGDNAYGRDSDSSAVFRSPHVANTALLAADIPASVTAAVDLVVGGSGAAASWAQM